MVAAVKDVKVLHIIQINRALTVYSVQWMQTSNCLAYQACPAVNMQRCRWSSKAGLLHHCGNLGMNGHWKPDSQVCGTQLICATAVCSVHKTNKHMHARVLDTSIRTHLTAIPTSLITSYLLLGHEPNFCSTGFSNSMPASILSIGSMKTGIASRQSCKCDRCSGAHVVSKL